ncbi:MAG: hypothetical protein ACAI43_24395 [Phycisphaerae bacterium]
MRILKTLLTLAIVFAPAGLARAATVVNGLTVGIANSGGANGTHFHSTGGDAEVGSYFTFETVRGTSEFDLTGVVAGTATMTFDLKNFGNYGQTKFNGQINVLAYQGDNANANSDFQAASFASGPSFNTTALIVGDTVTLDVTAILAQALTNGYTSLGFRLEAVNPGDHHAVLFNNFQLTVADPVAPQPNGVPLPAAVWAGLALGGAVFARKSKVV